MQGSNSEKETSHSVNNSLLPAVAVGTVPLLGRKVLFVELKPCQDRGGTGHTLYKFFRALLTVEVKYTVRIYTTHRTIVLESGSKYSEILYTQDL